MTHAIRTPEEQDEPALLRDQFRQLLRYRALLATGVAVGLLGGAFLALGGEDTYTATGEVQVRSATADPFATGASADKGINIGSERQTAVSDTVGTLAAGALSAKGDKADAHALLRGLQVTNPPNTLTLRFAYTTTDPALARIRADALAKAYLEVRRQRTEGSIDNMVKGYRSQLKPLVEQRDQLEELTAGSAAEDTDSARANLVVAISELNRKIVELKALDTTPGYLNKEPVTPTSPTGAGLPLLLGLGAVVGVALGLLLSWVRLVFDPAVRSTRELVRSLGAPSSAPCPGTADRPGHCSPSDAAAADSPRSTGPSPSGSPTTRRSPGPAGCWSRPRAGTTRPPLPPPRTWPPRSPRWAATSCSSRPISAPPRSPRGWGPSTARPGPAGPPRAWTAAGPPAAARTSTYRGPAPSPWSPGNRSTTCPGR